MAEKNSLWKNIRNKAAKNRRTGAKPKKPTAEMLRQEAKIKAKKYPGGGPVGDDDLYNMQRALELGYTPDETGHWPSVDHETGMFLKSKEHPTAWMEYLYGYTLNPELNKNTNVVVNPKGYFGENQLQYIPKAQYSKGGLFVGYDEGGYYAEGGGDDDKNKIQKAVASTTDVNVRALPEGLFEHIKANPIPRQPQIINVVDKRKQNPITKKPINPNRDLVGGQFEDTIPIEIIKSSYKHKVDPATSLAIGLLESRMGTTDPNVGHIMVDPYSDYIPGAEDMVMTIKEKQDYAKKLGYTDPLLQLQAYNGLGVLSNKRGEIGKSAYGIPIPKEGIDLRKNPLYAKKVQNIRDSVIMESPDLRRLMEYHKPKMDGGVVSPYMYYAGGPMQYEVGGKVWKHIGAGAYALGEGMLDTITMGATDQLTDKGFEWLTKVGNKNIDLNDPDDVKFLKTQQQIKGYGNLGGAVGTAVLTGNVQGAIGQGAKGLNTAFQASDWASDDFKKWSNIGSTAVGIGAGFAGGLNTQGAVEGLGEVATKFGSQASKYAPYANQAMGLLGNSNQPLWQQAEARQEYLNSPEYLAMKERQNQEYVNQGLSFASHGGNINNNSLNLQNSMRNRYNSYRKKSKGGTFHQYGINQIPDSAGLHHQNAYGGVPIGPDAMAEGGEYVLDGNYVVSDRVDGMDTQTDEFGNTMAENLKTRLNKYTLRDLDSKNKGALRRPNDSIAQNTIDQIKQQAIMETEMARAEAQAQEEQNQAMKEAAVQYAAAGGKLNKDITKIVEEEYAAAYGGYINPKKYKGLNMPYSGGGKLPKEVLRARVEAHMSPEEADAYVEQYAKGGGIHIKKSKRGTFTAAAKKHGKSVQEFARQVLANKGNYSSAMVKKANFARNAAKWHHGQGGPMVSNVPQPFDGPSAQNRGGMMVEYAMGGNMYAEGGPDYDPEKLKAEGYVEYPTYWLHPTKGYIDKPAEEIYSGGASSAAFYDKNLEEYLRDPSYKVGPFAIKPLEGKIGYPSLPLKSSYIDTEGDPRFYGDNNIGFNLQVQDFGGPEFTGESWQDNLNRRYPILNEKNEIQTTPEDYNRLVAKGLESKSFSDYYNQVQSTRDKVRRAYQNKSPYLDNIVDKPAKTNTYLKNLNTPNVVDNQGNTSSILGRSRNRNTSQPIQPIEAIQSKPYTFPTDNTIPGLIPNNYPESSYRPATLTPEEQDMLNRMSNTVGFIPNDVMSGKLGTSTAPYAYEEGPVNTSVPRVEPSIEQNIRFIPPGGSDMIEDLPGYTPNPIQVSDEAIGQSYLGTAANPNLPKLTFTQSDATKYGLNPNDVNIIEDPKVKSPNQPNQGLTGLDYASMGMQALGPLSQLYYGLKGPDDVNYERITADKIDPYRAITLANEESRRAQDLAGYNLRQNAPTSGSYMANMRALGLGAGKQRGAQTAATQYQADVANTQMQNQVNAQNAQISMQEQIDRLQERDAARTNVTEGLSGLGSSTANMIRDYRTNQVNQTIARNIGTNDWRFDTVTNEIVFKRDGKEFRLPAQTVVGTNPANIATGQIQQLPSLQIQRDFDNRLNESFGNRFTGPNAGK